jgi:uncharacterized repeat protein (TIGR01451 family)
MRKRLFLVIVPLVLALALITAMVAVAGGPFSEDFDSYNDGDQMHGVNGWKGWGNDVNAGALVSNLQSRSGPNSVDVNTASDLVHEFSASSGQWILTAWQYIPGNVTGQPYFIVLNTYDDPCATCNWSLQLCFDPTSGNVFDDSAATCSGNSVPFVTDQWAEIRLEIDLDADSFDVYYNNAALVTAGVWSQHTSGGGTATIGALDLWSNGSSAVYYDDISLVPDAPDIAVRKSPDSQNITTGGNANFTIDITNTGTITWNNVTATDALVPACDNATTDLGPGEVYSYSCTDVGVAASYTNTVVVVADITGGPTMTVSDDAAVTVTPPTSVSLSGFGGDDATLPTGLVVAVLGMAVAAGLFVVNKRRSQQI